MCVRYVGFDQKIQRLRERFPGDNGEFLVEGGEVREGSWGIQPAWAKTGDFGRKNAYNARAETLAEKPTFRVAYRNRRCVIPAASFYERAEGRWKLITPTQTDQFLIAGLFEEPNKWTEVPTFTFVTTEPNQTIVAVQDRMPVILTPQDAEVWLKPSTEPDQLRPLLIPCPPEWTVIEDAGPIRAKKAATSATLFD